MRFLADESLRGDVVRALQLHLPELPLTRAQDVGLRTRPDPEVLEWAAAAGCILLTSDYATMPDHAYDRMTAGLAMPGVVVVPLRMPVAEILREMEMILICSDSDEWNGKIMYLPL